LLVLDLNLSGRDGFELLKLAVSGSFHTIVVSANTDRALEAFEYGVLDFIGKPFSRDRLRKALSRYKDTASRNDRPTKYLSVRQQNTLSLVPIHKIVYIQGARIYSEIRLDDGTARIHDKSLSLLLTLLPHHFIRTHKSYIVNLHCIQHFRSLGASRYELKLKTDEILPVSRARYKEIKHLIP
jgi:two-component system response regulator LytT